MEGQTDNLSPTICCGNVEIDDSEWNLVKVSNTDVKIQLYFFVLPCERKERKNTYLLSTNSTQSNSSIQILVLRF